MAAFIRTYVDLTPEAHEALKAEARRRETSMKKLLNDLIVRECVKTKEKESSKHG